MHRFRHAILRTPSASFAEGITTAVSDAPPSYERMLGQHAAYAGALERAGLTVEILPPLESHPDAHFVEDVAVVLPEIAVVTRPGAEARRGEAEHIAAALSPHRPVVRIDAPARLDGGDVLVVEDRVFVGRSERTNEAGVRALADLLEPFGRVVIPVPVAAGLHFKSSVNLVGPGVLLATATFAARSEFTPFEVIAASDGAAYAANALRINEHLLIAAGFPQLAGRLRHRGFEVVELEMSEAEKMDGGLTCLSLRM